MTAIPSPIAPVDKKCFAFVTISTRLPEILVKALDYFRRSYLAYLTAHHGTKLTEKEKLGAEEEAKSILGSFSKLRYEMMTDKPLTLLNDSEADVAIWNKVYKEWSDKLGKPPTYYSVSWLYAECFMYRKVREIFAVSKFFKSFDPFFEQKRNALKQSMAATITLSQFKYSND